MTGSRGGWHESHRGCQAIGHYGRHGTVLYPHQYSESHQKQGNGYREYSDNDVKRLRFVLSARQLGFSVEDIQEILGHADKKKTPCPTVRRLIDQRLHETEERLTETLKLKDRMQRAVLEWNQKPDKAPTGHMLCHLIEEFTAEE